MRGKAVLLLGVFTSVSLFAFASWSLSAPNGEPVPHGQDRMPGPPQSPEEAARKMTVPPGFTVEVVASEPDIVNPVAMTFDERGRIWITESLEYPRHAAGPGRDRIKILEDTDGDGRADKFTVFADGLNIPSGIALGHGGVWVANAPDILFLQDTDGDGKADRRDVVVTGFGRHDTHELPNSLTWGPDGFLYGLNGVFNEGHVRQGDKDYRFTCTMFRINPRTHAFELFCEGTSNPWGIAWDTEGSAFVSACVIDHLWHLTETGYYHRQGGPYPPFTWKLDSIVKHRHQKAAYCGLHFFDSDAYPPEYRERLYMGNIHGGCINVDTLQRDGSTYRATAGPDFLTANDPWFMPVSQKTGPDGCLYVLDWCDRYHCYQDAMRDPKGIDRERGRLYRIRYKNTPRAPKFDLGKESDEQLIERLHSPNIYFRETAQRLLCERNNAATRARLEQLVLDPNEPRKARMHALWVLVGTGSLDKEFHRTLLGHKEAAYRAWGVRAAGNFHRVDAAIRDHVLALVRDRSPDVLLQIGIAARKIEGVDALPVLLQVLSACGDDKLIPHIIWENLHPLLENHSDRFVQMLQKTDLKQSPNLAALIPRAVERILGQHQPHPGQVIAILKLLIDGKAAEQSTARQCLAMLAREIETGEINGSQVKQLREHLLPVLHKLVVGDPASKLHDDSATLAATLKDPEGMAIERKVFASEAQPEELRLKALEALTAAGDVSVLDAAARVLAPANSKSTEFRGRVLSDLGRLQGPRVAKVVLAQYPRMEPDLQARAIELLTQRTAWSKQLLEAIGNKKVPVGALNETQVRRMLGSKDPELIKAVKLRWGTIREGRNPEREQVVNQMRGFLGKSRGDPVAGREAFKKVCGQCHKIYGEGQEVGPDLTGSGRGSFDQLLSNVFDPSLVIGAAYQATMVTTTRGRVLTGLLVEDNDQKVVLKLQGEKLEIIPRGDVDEMTVSPVSLMPEGLEKQFQPQELADLFAFLTLDRPPEDPKARKIPGAP